MQCLETRFLLSLADFLHEKGIVNVSYSHFPGAPLILCCKKMGQGASPTSVELYSPELRDGLIQVCLGNLTPVA